MTAEESHEWLGFIDALMDPREWDAILGRNREVTRNPGSSSTPDLSLPEPDPEREGRLRLPEEEKKGLPGRRVHRLSEEEPEVEATAPTCCRCGELIVLGGSLIRIRSEVRDCAKCTGPIHKECAQNVLGSCRTRTLCRSCGEWKPTVRYRKCRACGGWACSGCYEWESGRCEACDVAATSGNSVSSEPGGLGALGDPSSIGLSWLGSSARPEPGGLGAFGDPSSIGLGWREYLTPAAVAQQEKWMERRYPSDRCHFCRVSPVPLNRISSVSVSRETVELFEGLARSVYRVESVLVGTQPREELDEETFCCFCLESFADNNIESTCATCDGPIHYYDCIWENRGGADCRREQAEQQRRRRRPSEQGQLTRAPTVRHFDPRLPSPYAQMELTLAVVASAAGHAGLVLEWLRALAALAPSWNSVLTAFATYKAAGVLQHGAQKTSEAIQRTVDAGAARVEETIGVAAEEAQEVVRGVGSASRAMGAAAAVLTVLYFLRFCAVCRCGRRLRKLGRKFVWPSPFAHMGGARDRGRASQWAAIARQAVGREEPTEDLQRGGFERAASPLSLAAAPRLGATTEAPPGPERPQIALERLCNLGPPAPVLDERKRAVAKEQRWGLEYEQVQAQPFWAAQQGKTVAFVYSKGTRAGAMRRVRVEQYDSSRGHIKTLDPGAPSGTSRTYNVRYLLHLQTEGGQRPRLGAALVSRAAGCLAGVAAAEPWRGPAWSAIRSRLRSPPAEPPQRDGEGQQTLALADQPPQEERVSAAHGCFVECTAAFPAWPPSLVVYDEFIEPTLLKALQGRHSVAAKLFSLDHPRYGDALRKVKEDHLHGRVRILLDTHNFECPSCSGQTALLSALFSWGVELRHTRPVSHIYSYMHEKTWLFDEVLYAIGSANGTKNSAGNCEENCGFFSIRNIVEEAASRFEEGWGRATPIDATALDDVERCKERRRSKSVSRARSQSELRGATEDRRSAEEVGVPERYSIGSVPPARSCPEIGGRGGQAKEAWVGRWREDSRPGIREVPPQSYPPATRRASAASTRALAALGSLPEAGWSDARSRGRSSAHSQGD